MLNLLKNQNSSYPQCFTLFACSGETEDTFIADLSVGLATVINSLKSEQNIFIVVNLDVAI